MALGVTGMFCFYDMFEWWYYIYGGGMFILSMSMGL